VGTSVGPAASRGASVEDEVLLRLAVYRSLGMTVERDEATGEYGKVIVSNGKKGDVHVVNLDGKFSKFFYSNYFWGVL
jgi:kinetochore protein Spc24